MQTPAVITSAQEITPDWLTACLRTSKQLPAGAVLAVEQGTPWETESCLLVPLTIHYSSEAPASAPRHLVWKLYHQEWWHAGGGEWDLYTRIGVEMPNQPALATCYEVVFLPERKLSYFLMDNLLVTHRLLPRPLEPDALTLVRLQQIIDELLKFHTCWWEHPRLLQRPFMRPSGGPLCMPQAGSPETIRIHAQQFEAELPSCMARLGAHVPSRWRAICERALHAWADLYIRRTEAGRQLTLAHGDFHLWNIFFPKDPQTHRLLLLDWERLMRSMGPYDVAYLLMNDIDPALRRQVEQPLLEYYYRGLCRGGVENYTWEECRQDYRLATIVNLFPPLRWGRLDQLERAIAAFDDWGGADVLGC